MITPWFAVVKATGSGGTTLRETSSTNMCTAGFSPVLEPNHILRNGGKKKPADIFVSDWSEGKGACFDVAVTCPLQKKYINRAANEQLYAAEDYAENVKIPKYSEACAAQNLLCIPLVFESFGGMTKNTEETLLRTARFYCHRSIENSIGITQMFQPRAGHGKGSVKIFKPSVLP